MSEIEKVQKNWRQDKADEDRLLVAVAIRQRASRYNPNAPGKQEDGEIFPYTHGVPVQNIQEIEGHKGQEARAGCGSQDYSSDKEDHGKEGLGDGTGSFLWSFGVHGRNLLDLPLRS